jgi:hypothetical protein
MEVGRVVAMDTAICFLLSPPILPGFILLPTVLPSRPLHPTCSACCTPLWPGFLSDCGCRWIGYGLECEEGSNGSARVLQKTEPIGSVHTHTHTYAHTHSYTYNRTYTHMYTYTIHLHKYTFTHTYTHMHTHVHTNTYMHTHSHMYTHPSTYIHTHTDGLAINLAIYSSI